MGGQPEQRADFFQTGVLYSNNVSVTGSTDESSFRLSYTNHDQTGVYENSSLNRNTLSFAGNSQVSEKLSASVSANYVQQKGQGRPLTGYGESVMSQFTQWFHRQLDMDRLRNYINPMERSVRGTATAQRTLRRTTSTTRSGSVTKTYRTTSAIAYLET